MWWKVVLLLLYLAVLFVLSRLLEAVAYYEGGYLASRLLDPVSLSVKKLKLLLDQRGVSYAGALEKQELTELVSISGEVSEGELESATVREESTSSTNFTCGGHFFEEVEDTKDSVWVVQVVSDSQRHFMDPDNWELFVKLVSRFGIRTGVFDCSLDWRLCERKGWLTTRIVLALPQGYRAKDNVILRSYMGASKTQAVYDWVNLNLASRIQTISSEEQLLEWFAFKKQERNEAQLRVILFSLMKIPPMFLSVLSVKFTGRVKFGTVNTKSSEGLRLSQHMQNTKYPCYLILTPENNYTFGLQVGEYLNYQSLGLFLRTLHPEVNDVFLLTLVLVNILCWFELFISYGNVFKRLGCVMWFIGKWNFMLILLWLPLLGLFKLPYMDMLLEYGLKALRLLGTTIFASWIRSDWLWYNSISCSFLVATFLIFASIVGIIYYYIDVPDSHDSNNNHTNFWNFQLDAYLNELLDPMANLVRPVSRSDLDLEIGMELLIERLAVPNFWLQPMISTQYINDLPIWKYTGPSVDSDIGSDTDCPSPCHIDSDCDEAGSGLEETNLNELDQRPLMFICEKCRAVQKDRDNQSRSPQEIEQERLESESACAKYLMDGDYKCMCLSNIEHGEKSPKKERYKNSALKSRTKPTMPSCDTESFMPPGMIATTECAICLESYKYAVDLCGLPCRHSFHQQCILGWLSRDNHCCPVCRWPAYKAKPCSAHQHTE